MKLRSFILGVLALLIISNLHAQYTLQDDDVIVENGIITECSYDYSVTDIIIPEVLDGQTVVGIADGDYGDYQGVFGYTSITSVILPSTIEYIGEGAFVDSDLESVDLGLCNSLVEIGIGAFYYTQLTSIDFTSCVNLEIINNYAFGSSNIDGLLDLSSCVNLRIIGEGAFSYNYIDNCDFSNLPNLKIIGGFAFNENEITTVDLSGLTSLTFLGYGALAYNGFSTVYLPTNSDYSALGWKDEYGNIYAGGDAITELETLYYVPAEYTLTDDDVVVEDGVIVSCSYNFELKNIVIPQVLDSQTIIGIADKDHWDGVFDSKDLMGVTIPSTLEFIGNSAFNGNMIGALDISGFASLERLGEYAFGNNDIVDLDISGCSNLKYVGNNAFSSLNVNDYNLDLTGSPLLDYIGEYAFSGGIILSVDFSQSSNLRVIAENAFYGNEFASIDLSACTSLIYIGSQAFLSYSSGTAENFDLPINSENPTIDWKDGANNTYAGGSTITNFSTYYYLNMPYTVSDFDVTIVNGIITEIEYGTYSEIIIPETLQGQTVIGIGVSLFENEDISSITLPSTLQIIDNYAFYRCDYLSEVYFNEGLLKIGNSAFERTALATIDLPESIEQIGRRAFNNSQMDTVDLSLCNNLLYIGAAAFDYNNFDAFVLPENTEYSIYEWKHNYSELNAGDTIPNASYYYYVPYPYELTDADVVVEDGFIMSCSYDYKFKNIVIPQILQSQTIVGIYNSVFKNETIFDIQLPTTLQYVNDSVFFGLYATINLQECNNLVRIGEYAFSGMRVTSLSLNEFVNLEEIGAHGLDMSALNSFDMSGCTSLIYLGEEFISGYSYYGSDISLPTPSVPGFQFNYWEDTNGTTYNGGAIIDDFFTEYSANLTQIEFTAGFNVLSGGQAVEGATITIDETDYVTDSQGHVDVSELAAGTYTYLVIADEYYEMSGDFEITDSDITVNIELISTDLISESIPEVQVYPNPASDYLNIINIKGQHIVIADLSGRVVIELNEEANETQIDIDNLPSGVYVVCVGDFRIKFIKN